MMQILIFSVYSFSKTVSSKNHGQVNLDKKGFHNALIFSFTATPSANTPAIHLGDLFFLQNQSYVRVLLQSYGRLLVFLTG